jgi:lipopolysaccharide export system permease protein
MMMVTGGILTGFFVFITTDIVLTLGVSETIPVMMAAWTTAAVTLLLGISALLHLEDG